MKHRKARYGKVLMGVLITAVVVAGIAWYLFPRTPPHRVEASTTASEEQEPAESITVKVVRPQLGGMERKTTQPGTVRAFEYEEIYPQVAGLLAHQKVDIGDTVKKGQLLAEIDAPELVKEEQHAAAALKQAQAQVEQMKANVTAAEAEVEKAESTVISSKAEEKRSRAFLNYRQAQYVRIEGLAHDRAVDERLVDEQFKYRDAAEAAVDSAVAAVKTAQADVKAKTAKVLQARADLLAAEAKVDVAAAELDKARVFVDFTKIRSAYDGVVAARNYHPGTFLPAGKSQALPLFVVQRTDLMRVIVQVPDLDAPFCDVGDQADLAINSLPTTLFSYPISRIANSQAQGDRTMRVEMDVPNDKKMLRDGMYGLVTIHLQAGLKNALRVPSTAVSRHDGKIRVFVVRDGKIIQVPVKLGLDTGKETEVVSGLKPNDLVVLYPRPDLPDGTEVHTELEQPKLAADAHN